MRRHLIKTALLAACTVTIPLSAQQTSAAEPEFYFYPKYKWSVEENAQPNSCSLTNQLNNGYAVTISGTANRFDNVSIDFKQDIFDKGMKYEVQYTIPSMTSVILPTTAIENTALKSSMAQHIEFSKALKSSPVLDVRIRTNEFRIYLTGLGNVLPKFQNCLDGSSMQMAKATSPKPPQKTVSIPKQPKPIKDAFAPPPPMNVDTNVEPPKPQKYTEKLAAQMKASGETYSKKPDPQPLPIKKQVSAPKINHVKHEKVVADFTGTTDPVAKIESLPPVVTPMTKPTPPKKIEPVKTATTHTSSSALNSKVAMLQKKNAALQAELKIAFQDAKDERLSIANGNWNLEQATMKYNESERQVMRLGRHLQTTKAECSAEKAELENMLFDPKLTNQQQLAKLAALETDLEDAKAQLYRQQRQYEERIKLLEQRLNAQY